jgi:hypothetical protein
MLSPRGPVLEYGQEPLFLALPQLIDIRHGKNSPEQMLRRQFCARTALRTIVPKVSCSRRRPLFTISVGVSSLQVATGFVALSNLRRA